MELPPTEDLNDDFILGIKLFYGIDGQKQDKEEAARIWLEAAEKGHKLAQVATALCFLLGEGVSKSTSKGDRWSLISEGNLTHSANFLGSYDKSIQFCKDEANCFEFSSQFIQHILGYYYSNVEYDIQQAINWYQKAANQDFAPAQNNLGYCYQHGIGVKMDEKRAFFNTNTVHT